MLKYSNISAQALLTFLNWYNYYVATGFIHVSFQEFSTPYILYSKVREEGVDNSHLGVCHATQHSYIKRPSNVFG